MMQFRYEPGDLLAFDNRRVLHGRAGYEAKGGTRFIEGIYSDRDELYSRIRTLRRQQRARSVA
jgi:gamma-butyrobetaine dioxygenase